VDVQHWTKVGSEIVGAEGRFVDDEGAPWFEFVVISVES
jgi:hypothetical protein